MGSHFDKERLFAGLILGVEAADGFAVGLVFGQIRGLHLPSVSIPFEQAVTEIKQ